MAVVDDVNSVTITIDRGPKFPTYYFLLIVTVNYYLQELELLAML